MLSTLDAYNFGTKSHGIFIILTDLHFGMMQLVYILNKKQQLKDSTLQNGILGQSTKNTDIFMFSFEWLKRD